jgi:RHS repeat-associated protein
MRYLADPNQPDALFARVAAGGTTAWYLRDNINSVRQVVSPTGTVLNAVTYDSFGNILNETNPAAGDRFKYTGREYDAELGIYYYRARYYDPATGRFLGEDPKGFDAGDANFYRYVGNQPTGRIDPSGMDWSDWVVSRMPDSWVDYLGSSRSNWIGNTSNYFAGHADALTFGLTSYARRGLGWDNVNYNSDYYLGGQIGGSIHSFALGYGAAGRVPQAGTWAYSAYRGAQGYTVAGSVYGVGHSSYVLATDPQNFGFTDALGFVPLGGYVTSRGLTAAQMWWRPRSPYWRAGSSDPNYPMWPGLPHSDIPPGNIAPHGVELPPNGGILPPIGGQPGGWLRFPPDGAGPPPVIQGPRPPLPPMGPVVNPPVIPPRIPGDPPWFPPGFLN